MDTKNKNVEKKVWNGLFIKKKKNQTYRNYGTIVHVATVTSIQRPSVQFPWQTFLGYILLNIVWQNVLLTHQIQANWQYASIMNYFFSIPLRLNDNKNSDFTHFLFHSFQFTWKDVKPTQTKVSFETSMYAYNEKFYPANRYKSNSFNKIVHFLNRYLSDFVSLCTNLWKWFSISILRNFTNEFKNNKRKAKFLRNNTCCWKYLHASMVRNKT